MKGAVRDGVFPGAVLAVRQGGVMQCLATAGHVSTEPPGNPVTPTTIYDLASLTKPLVTATSILLLVQAGRVGLSTPIGKILAELEGAPIGSATMRDLLTHSSGLPGWRPLYERVNGAAIPGGDSVRNSVKQEVLQLVRNEPLIYQRGERCLYSDLGFILLGLAVERVGGISLDQYFDEAVVGPLQAGPLLFAPLRPSMEQPARISIDRSEIAPTEFDEWRGRLLWGEAHDENVAAMGGVAGHAGLFGTAEAVLAVSGSWLRSHCGSTSILDRDLVREFTKRQTIVRNSSWALGWDTPTVPSSSGRHLSHESFGHLGYTGTSLWIDPQCELEVVLLSNRVHPTRRNEKIREFRPLIHDVVYHEAGSRQ